MLCRGCLFPTLAAGTDTIDVQAVASHGIAQSLGDLALLLLDGGIHELIDTTTLNADDMIVMRALVQLEDGAGTLEMMPLDQASLLELGQHPIDRGQANVLTTGAQVMIDLLCAHVPPLAMLQQFQDAQSWDGDLQSGAAQFPRSHVSSPDSQRKQTPQPVHHTAMVLRDGYNAPLASLAKAYPYTFILT